MQKKGIKIQINEANDGTVGIKGIEVADAQTTQKLTMKIYYARKYIIQKLKKKRTIRPRW